MKKPDLSIFLFLSCFLSSSFAGAEGIDLADDSTKLSVRNLSHSVFFGAGYGDNLVLGSSISKPQSFYYGSLSYGFKNEFFLSVSTFYISDFEVIPAYNVFSANYNKAFNSWFDIAASLSAFKPRYELSDTLFSSFFYGDLTAGFDWRIVYTKINVSQVFSSKKSTFVQVRNSRYFETPEFFSGKMYFSIDPYINLLIGSLTKITTSEGTTIGVNSTVWTGGGYGGGSATESGSGSGNGSGRGSGTISTSTIIKTTSFFGLMEMDFGIPVSLNAGRFTLEVEPGYILPMFNDPLIPNPEGFSLILSCYLKIF